MNLFLLTPKGSKKIEEVTEVTLPTTTGEISVLQGHEPLVAELAPGTIIVKMGNKDEHFATFEGFAKITGDEIRIFSAGFEEAKDLDEAKIQESIDRAKQRKAEDISDVEFAATAALLERELAKLRTIRRRRR